MRGFINVDRVELKGVDMVFDLNKLPYPFSDESVDEIYIAHVLEHLKPDLLDLMAEFHRILKHGGKLTIIVPFYNSMLVWNDPTHERAFDYDTFKYFRRGAPMSYYTTRHFSQVEIDDIPSYLGALIPRTMFRKRTRLFVARMIGNIIMGIHVEMIK